MALCVGPLKLLQEPFALALQDLPRCSFPHACGWINSVLLQGNTKLEQLT